MAKIFKGMSQTNFLDGLVEASGKNGHELYDYLIDLLGRDTAELPANDTPNALSTVTKQPFKIDYFRGSLKEFRAFLEKYDPEGVFYKCKSSGRIVNSLTATSPEGLANYAANLFDVPQFRYILPVDGYVPYTFIGFRNDQDFCSERIATK